jgi:hypothetical protein
MATGDDMTTPSTTIQGQEQSDIARAIVDLSAEIDQLITGARPVRQLAWRDPERRLAAYALDDMIHLLTEVKLRLQNDIRTTRDPAPK